MSKQQFALIAGVEITQGQVGSLDHGDIDGRHLWGDPVAAAQRWAGEGAQWVHVADLDAAAGTGSNADVVARTVHAVRGRVRVEVAGGVRDQASLDRAFHVGADRVVLDPAALADPDWVAAAIHAHPGRIAAGITAHHEGGLVAPGSDVDGLSVDEVVERLRAAHCPAYVVTDVDAKGLRKSRDRHVLMAVCRDAPGAEVIAFGGITRLDDLHALADLAPHGVAGAVVDRALYTDAFTFAEAVAAIEPRFDMFFWGPPQP